MKRLLVVVAVLLVAAVITIVSTMRYIGSGRSGDAIQQSMSILRACEAYRDNPNNPEAGKRFPTTLADLVKPPFGGSSFLRSGEADLLDPWGHSYRYAVVTSASGEQEAYVWAERIADGKLKLLGAKRCADGEVRIFGLE